MKILTVLCQRVGATGSGIVVKETVERLPSHGAEVMVVCGGYPGDNPGALFSGPPPRLEMIEFGSESPTGLPFPIVGMSNDMPYPSVAFKDLQTEDVDLYLGVWRANLEAIVLEFQPNLIHVHHLWLLAGLVATAFPSIPMVVSIHGTDLRRASDCRHLKFLVEPAVAQAAALILLTEQSLHAALAEWPQLDASRCITLGNGYNDSLFFVAHPEEDGVLEAYGVPLRADA